MMRINCQLENDDIKLVRSGLFKYKAISLNPAYEWRPINDDTISKFDILMINSNCPELKRFEFCLEQGTERYLERRSDGSRYRGVYLSQPLRHNYDFQIFKYKKQLLLTFNEKTNSTR